MTAYCMKPGQKKRVAVLGSIVCGALTVAQPAMAQPLDFSGYYENTLQLDYTAATKLQVLDASKLRLDAGLLITRGLEVRGNVNLIVSLGQLQRNISPYLPPSVARELQAAGIPDTFELNRARLFVDNLFVTWVPGNFRFRAGRQQLSWGPGYSYNPTDLFHRKTLVDPTYEKEGVTALRADYRWGIGGQVSLIGAPKSDLSHSGYALRAGTHVSQIGYDVAVTAHRVTDSTGLDPVTLAPLTQRRRALGLDFVGELFGLGVWLEGNYNWMELEADFLRLVFGTDYTFNDGTYVMLEALYNGRSTGSPPYPASDWLANLFYGEPVGPGWILAGVRRDISDFWSGNLYAFLSPGGSALLNPRVDASITQNIDLVLYGGLTLGDEEGSFPSGLLSLVGRLTVYF
ncbi:MAG: hypothetical protein JSW71_00960 [Gemmatimonadota bacterium]|nr:MAG: hypothetical protein JSW71_00960 [Gemmatimonadota bacterium]